MADFTFDFKDKALFWFRRDLRLTDNRGLSAALASGAEVIPLFIFDKQILEELPKEDKRVSLIHDTLTIMDKELRKHGSGFVFWYGTPDSFFQNIDCKAVYTNKDYEPYATERDDSVAKILQKKGIEFHLFKDHVIFEEREVVKPDGKPYTVFTPFSRAWKKKLSISDTNELKVDLNRFSKFNPVSIPSLESMGFKHVNYSLPTILIDQNHLSNYSENRDIPYGNHTTNLSVHLRFGLVSVRWAVQKALERSEKLVDELIWREFYSMILWNFPEVVANNFKREYDSVPWKNDKDQFEKWCNGTTGYPLVDAGMRELNETGYMNNRARMIAAGFLTKHLLTHWSLGEAYFAKKLMDYDLASNNGNWQWAAGTGCDAAPYFRIFNPVSQQQKFDPQFKYVKQWVNEFGTQRYPAPIVDHTSAREETLEAFKLARKK